ncbi:MAG: ribbon-helix-helix domain-containing protein [Alphaproteobacteria bacterium]|nr:ribbon-helix-helix domain-containing protein [Alphaproteobacteria bacterium]
MHVEKVRGIAFEQVKREPSVYRQALSFGRDNDDIDLEAVAPFRRNVRIGPHRTSIRIEPAFWAGLQKIAHLEETSVHQIVTDVEANRPPELTRACALRVFVVSYFQNLAS